jgi:hypothetical protein
VPGSGENPQASSPDLREVRDFLRSNFNQIRDFPLFGIFVLQQRQSLPDFNHPLPDPVFG